jgi:hypothetical protein
MIDIIEKLNPINILKIRQLNGIFIDSKAKEFIKSLGIKKLRGRDNIIDSANCFVYVGDYNFHEAEETRKQWSNGKVEWRIISLEELNYLSAISDNYKAKDYIVGKRIIFPFNSYGCLTRNTCIKYGRTNYLVVREYGGNRWIIDENLKVSVWLVC